MPYITLIPVYNHPLHVTERLMCRCALPESQHMFTCEELSFRGLLLYLWNWDAVPKLTVEQGHISSAPVWTAMAWACLRCTVAQGFRTTFRPRVLAQTSLLPASLPSGSASRQCTRYLTMKVFGCSPFIDVSRAVTAAMSAMAGYPASTCIAASVVAAGAIDKYISMRHLLVKSAAAIHLHIMC